MSRSMSIAAVISSLQCGGAERVMTTLCNAWSIDHRVTLFTFASAESIPFFTLAPAVDHRPLNLLGVSRSPLPGVLANARRVLTMRGVLRSLRPDVVVAFGDQTNVIALLAGVSAPWPVIVSERTDPRNVPLNRAWTILRQLAYRRAAAIVLVAEEGREWFGRSLASRVHVLPNPVTTRLSAHVVSPQVEDVVRLVTVGRLAREKGLDLLLHALHMLPADLAAQWTLEVVGDGPDRGMLMRLAEDLRLADRVRWVGFVPDPAPYVQSGDVFVLPSRFEGFPNALAEAMALGRTVLSTDCRSGPRELITDGVNGLLVAPNDPAAIASGLERLLRDRALRARLAEAAPAATRGLAVDAIRRRWEALFEEVTTQRGRE